MAHLHHDESTRQPGPPSAELDHVVRSVEQFPTDGPIPLADLVGRAPEVAALVGDLKKGQHRILVGSYKSGKTSVAAAAAGILEAGGWSVVAVDLFRLSGADALAKALNASALNEPPHDSDTGGATLTDVIRTLDASAGRAGDRLVFFIDGFHELATTQIFGKVASVGQELRAALDATEHAVCLFVGSASTVMRDLFSSTDQPFHHFGQITTLPTIPETAWREALPARFADGGCALTRAGVDRLLELSEGHARATMLLAKHTYAIVMASGSTSADAAAVEVGLRSALSAERLLADNRIAQVRALSKHGLSTALRVATGESPYKHLPPAMARQTLRGLENAGVVDHPRAGEYTIADPMLRHYLLADDGGADPMAAAPELALYWNIRLLLESVGPVPSPAPVAVEHDEREAVLPIVEAPAAEPVVADPPAVASAPVPTETPVVPTETPAAPIALVPTEACSAAIAVESTEAPVAPVTAIAEPTEAPLAAIAVESTEAPVAAEPRERRARAAFKVVATKVASVRSWLAVDAFEPEAVVGESDQDVLADESLETVAKPALRVVPNQALDEVVEREPEVVPTEQPKEVAVATRPVDTPDLDDAATALRHPDRDEAPVVEDCVVRAIESQAPKPTSKRGKPAPQPDVHLSAARVGRFIGHSVAHDPSQYWQVEVDNHPVGGVVLHRPGALIGRRAPEGIDPIAQAAVLALTGTLLIAGLVLLLVERAWNWGAYVGLLFAAFIAALVQLAVLAPRVLARARASWDARRSGGQVCEAMWSEPDAMASVFSALARSMPGTYISGYAASRDRLAAFREVGFCVRRNHVVAGVLDPDAEQPVRPAEAGLRGEGGGSQGRTSAVSDRRRPLPTAAPAPVRSTTTSRGPKPASTARVSSAPRSARPASNRARRGGKHRRRR